MIETLIFGIGIVLIVEGLAYALAPSVVERVLEQLRLLSLEQRRIFGLVALTLGVLLVWAARALGF